MNDLVSDKGSLRRFFSGIVEHVFYSEIGICDPDVVDYLADLLCAFVRMDRVYWLRNAKGRRLEEVAEMVGEAALGPDVSSDDRDRIVHRHVGDFTLFWTGVYPEILRKFRAADRKDHMVDYVEQGKRSYAIASELTPEDVRPPGRVFHRLSEHFEFCVYGLGEVRRGWEHSGYGWPGADQILS
jgi:hypothetical protein